jgi:hypothetical protein
MEKATYSSRGQNRPSVAFSLMMMMMMVYAVTGILTEEYLKQRSQMSKRYLFCRNSSTVMLVKYVTRLKHG